MSAMIVIVINFDNLKLLQENNYNCRLGLIVIAQMIIMPIIMMIILIKIV